MAAAHSPDPYRSEEDDGGGGCGPRPFLGHARGVRRGLMRLGRRLRQERPPASLSPNQLGVLSHLHRHGPATPGEVAAAERQRPQSLTRAFAELQAEGLIVRSQDRADRRQSVLAVTPAGRAALARDVAGRDDWLASALGTLTETEREVLRLAGALMERLALLDDAAAGGPGGGVGGSGAEDGAGGSGAGGERAEG
jgi:DNA-binding MarR family transcriptional regulator